MFSGIKAAAIRMWEHRYGFPAPDRTATNIRYYSAEQLRRFLQVVALKQAGYRLCKLVRQEPALLDAMARKLKENSHLELLHLHQLIYYFCTGKLAAFDQELDQATARLGIQSTLQQVIIPFLQKTELLSYQHKDYGTHYVVTAVRRKIIRAIESLPLATGGQQKPALLFLPEREHYDLILLYAHYLLRKQGFPVFYFGTDITAENLGLMVQETDPGLLITYQPSQSRHQREVLKRLVQQTRTSARFFVISGTPVATAEPAGDPLFANLSGLESAFRQLGAAPQGAAS